MTARLEFYDIVKGDDEPLAWVLAGYVPRIGDDVYIKGLETWKVQRVEWYFEDGTSSDNEIPQVAIWMKKHTN